MGRILKIAKPKTPKLVYVAPKPTVTAAPAPTTSSSSNTGSTSGGTTSTATPEQVAAQKAENLLRRNRSRLGTVLTSFRGIFSQNDIAANRKSLLGE